MSNNAVIQPQNGLLLTSPGSLKEQPMSIAPQAPPIKGDFDIQVVFSEWTLAPPNGSRRSRFALQCRWDGPEDSTNLTEFGLEQFYAARKLVAREGESRTATTHATFPRKRPRRCESLDAARSCS